MAKYCTKCGKELNPNGRCSCANTDKSKDSLERLKEQLSNLLFRLGIGTSKDNCKTLFERGKKIVPDIVSATGGEIPVRQYDVARLRSRILGKYAEGRIMVTNRRIVFRAAGISPSGNQIIQHDFSLDEIGGIEVKQTHRLSLMNIILSFILSLFIMDPLDTFFTAFSSKSSVLALIVGTILSLIAIVPVFTVKGKHWLKLIFASISTGIILGVTSMHENVFDFFLGERLLEYIDISFPIFIVWVFSLIRVSLVPDLRLTFQTKGAGDAVVTRRRVWGVFLKQPQEYSDFSEVLPGPDINRMTTEIMAMINDLQTSGDYAIENWKE